MKDNCIDQINKRGAAPEGGGDVLFTCPCRQKLRPVKFTQPGKIKRIRGVAYPCQSIALFILLSHIIIKLICFTIGKNYLIFFLNIKRFSLSLTKNLDGQFVSLLHL